MKIAVVGSGISGLSAALMLSKHHEVDIYEQDDRYGGHSHTITVPEDDNELHIDTGFIVCNNRNYPHFLQLLKRLKVPIQTTDMSFALHDIEQKLYYHGSSLAKLFVQKRNLWRPSYWHMLYDVIRFNRLAKQHLDDSLTIHDFIKQHRLSQVFYRWYLRPMCAAIWSAETSNIDQMPCETLLPFLHNHGLLDVHNRPQWYSIPGGSKRYVQAIVQKISGKHERNSKVQRILRDKSGVTVQNNGNTTQYNQVVIACHADQALNIIDQPSALETNLLSSFLYQPNKTFLHSDCSFMPPNKQAWACWNVQQSEHHQTFTYHMNQLQSLPTKNNYFVTLNPAQAISQNKIIASMTYKHPQFNKESKKAQQQHHRILGHNHCHYIGAYWGHGFHEDGVKSAIKAVEAMDARCLP